MAYCRMLMYFCIYLFLDLSLAFFNCLWLCWSSLDYLIKLGNNRVFSPAQCVHHA